MSPNAKKNIRYSLALLSLVLVVYLFRKSTSSTTTKEDVAQQKGLVSWGGKFMGKPYLLLFHPENAALKSKLDSLLNHQEQRYEMESPRAELYLLNHQDTLLQPSTQLLSLLEEAIADVNDTKNTWDPSSTLLYEGWEFSTARAKIKDSVDIALLLEKVGMDKFLLSDTLIQKTKPGVKLDFTTYGHSLALGEVAQLLEKEGVQNYFFQLGPYTLAKGTNERKELWKSKIQYPDSSGNAREGWIALDDNTVATAGNFKQSYLQDSLRKPWVLNPTTGYPVNHGLLQITVVTQHPKTAYLLAESLLVLGWKEAILLDEARKDIQLLLIYNEKGEGITTYCSPELKSFLSFPID